MKKAQLAQRKYLAIAVATASFAQVHSVSALAEEKSYQLEQVIVTSQKSDDRVQDIPATINVVSGDMLKQFEITKFSDLSQVTAGLSLDVLTSRRQSVNLRGVETNPDAGVADGVAVYWNDVNIRSDVAFQQLFDIQSIEVLRGPQGTLQGATSPAGAIHLRTRTPYLEGYRANISQTFSDNNGSNTEFGADMPIIPGELAIRVAGVYDAADVNDVKNITTGRNDTSLSRAGRFSALYQPGEIFSATLAYEYLEKSTDADNVLEGDQTGKPHLSPYDRTALAGINSVTTNRNNIASLNLAWDLGKNQVVWETGYYNSNQVALLDSDFANNSTADTTNLIPQKAERLIQEARLTTNISSDWTSLVGLYYQKDRSMAQPIVRSRSGNINVLTNLDIPSNGETYALFTHQKYQITDSSLIEAGVRYQSLHQFNKADAFILATDATSGAVLANRTIVQVPDANTHDSDAEVVTYSAKYSYTFTPDLMAYASYDQGFRPGGITATTRTGLPLSELAYDNEKSQGIEFGVKSAWLDNRVQVNADVFYQEFTNGLYRSQALRVNTDGVPGTEGSTARLVYNADSIIQGAELEVQGLITPNWNAGANISYVDAKYDNASIPTNSPTPTTQTEVVYHTISSGRIGTQPNWSATANSTYTLPLGPVDAYMTGLVKYQSSREDDSFANNVGLVAGYATVNLYVGIRDVNDAWDVTLFARNLFDKNGEVVPPEVDTTTTYLQARPNEGRVIGITGKYKFGKS